MSKIYCKFPCLQLVFNKLLKVCFGSFKKYVDDLMLFGCLKSHSDGIPAREVCLLALP